MQNLEHGSAAQRSLAHWGNPLQYKRFVAEIIERAFLAGFPDYAILAHKVVSSMPTLLDHIRYHFKSITSDLHIRREPQARIVPFLLG
jgi:hypothetical protein